ncbi:MAG TPA: ubiquinone/menaquinone biosynthesis methyltransferase [Desulfonatronum sp.]|nr:ubiquinone/menaquinone biosynthesis methyltransferase [Desulfonatronum sp.]
MITQQDDHSRQVSGLFRRIAPWYDFLNHLLSLGWDIVWRKQLVRCVRMHRTTRLLDLAAGTLDVSLEVVRQHPCCCVLALDFSLPMLAHGQKKIRATKQASIVPVVADGRALPLPDHCVDCATIAFGIRNILPRHDAYREVLRVLTPGGRFCILEFGAGRRKILRGMYNVYLSRILPWIGRIFSGDPRAYRYLAKTIKAFPDARALSRELLAAGFSRVYSFPLTAGIVQIHVAEKGRIPAQKNSLTPT